MINKSFFEKFSPLLYQTGLREDDYTREFLGFKQQIERILATICRFCNIFVLTSTQQQLSHHSEVTKLSPPVVSAWEFWDCWDKSLEDLLEEESTFFLTHRCLAVLGPVLRGEYCACTRLGDVLLSFNMEWLLTLALCWGLLFSFVSRNPLFNWRFREPLLSCYNNNEKMKNGKIKELPFLTIDEGEEISDIGDMFSTKNCLFDITELGAWHPNSALERLESILTKYLKVNLQICFAMLNYLYLKRSFLRRHSKVKNVGWTGARVTARGWRVLSEECFF